MSNLTNFFRTKITLDQLMSIGAITFILNTVILVGWENTSSIPIILITYILVLRVKYKGECTHNYSIFYLTYFNIMLLFLHIYNYSRLFVGFIVMTLIVGFIIGIINYYVYIKGLKD